MNGLDRIKSLALKLYLYMSNRVLKSFFNRRKFLILFFLNNFKLLGMIIFLNFGEVEFIA